jgi:hypothetical protein
LGKNDRKGEEFVGAYMMNLAGADLLPGDLNEHAMERNGILVLSERVKIFFPITNTPYSS